MRTIYQARQFIRDSIGKNVIVKVKGIRNKNEFINGKIVECYANIFIVDTGTSKKSFSYTDVLIGNIDVKYI